MSGSAYYQLVREAADERVRLLEGHLELLRQLRLKHLGGTP